MSEVIDIQSFQVLSHSIRIRYRIRSRTLPYKVAVACGFLASVPNTPLGLFFR